LHAQSRHWIECVLYAAKLQFPGQHSQPPVHIQARVSHCKSPQTHSAVHASDSLAWEPATVATTFRLTATHNRHDRRSDSRTHFVNALATRDPTAKPESNDSRADRPLNSPAFREKQKPTVQGKGLVPTFSASQKTWHRPPAQGVAPRPPVIQPCRASLDLTNWARSSSMKLTQKVKNAYFFGCCPPKWGKQSSRKTPLKSTLQRKSNSSLVRRLQGQTSTGQLLWRIHKSSVATSVVSQRSSEESELI